MRLDKDNKKKPTLDADTSVEPFAEELSLYACRCKEAVHIDPDTTIT